MGAWSAVPRWFKRRRSRSAVTTAALVCCTSPAGPRMSAVRLAGYYGHDIAYRLIDRLTSAAAARGAGCGPGGEAGRTERAAAERDRPTGRTRGPVTRGHLPCGCCALVGEPRQGRDVVGGVSACGWSVVVDVASVLGAASLHDVWVSVGDHEAVGGGDEVTVLVLPLDGTEGPDGEEDDCNVGGEVLWGSPPAGTAVVPGWELFTPVLRG